MPETPYLYYEDVNFGLLRLWGGRRGLDVLDVGCGYATTSQHLASLGNRVTGIESNPAAIPTASSRIGTVVQADLQKFDEVRERLGAARFDAILFADVLEHLAWPELVLGQYLELLRDGGSVLVSLPNIGLWSVRAAMLFGSFRYADTGVLDRTHLRFFTRSSARALLRSAGLVVAKTTYNPGIVRPFVPLVKKILDRGEGKHDPAAILESWPFQLYMKSIYPIERAVAQVVPGLLAFQMIFEARRS